MKIGAAENRSEDDVGVRKGPWTVEEDTILANYIATHGEGRWNSIARSAGKFSVLVFKYPSWFKLYGLCHF